MSLYSDTGYIRYAFSDPPARCQLCDEGSPAGSRPGIWAEMHLATAAHRDQLDLYDRNGRDIISREIYDAHINGLNQGLSLNDRLALNAPITARVQARADLLRIEIAVREEYCLAREELEDALRLIEAHPELAGELDGYRQAIEGSLRHRSELRELRQLRESLARR